MLLLYRRTLSYRITLSLIGIKTAVAEGGLVCAAGRVSGPFLPQALNASRIRVVNISFFTEK